MAVDVVYYDYRLRRLGVGADFRASIGARVAYVKDGHEVATQKNVVEIQTDKFNAAKEAFRVAEPEMPQELADAFRPVFGE